MYALTHYKKIIETALEQMDCPSSPKGLYVPIDYIMKLGGKRLRPIMTLMICDCFGGNHKNAIPAGLAVELFHNFSLIHDDIMDQAPLRRGQSTVHHKWDLNTGILSGDALLILAYRNFESYPPEIFSALSKLFSKTAIQVCEGQQYDMDFELRLDVTKKEYLKMIEYKTAVLVGAAMKMGAIVAGAETQQQNYIYEFGRCLGIAFQLQDDYLDAFGDPEVFGKLVGGDILSGKKTYLYLSAFEQGSPEEKKRLLHFYQNSDISSVDKVAEVKTLFKQTQGDKAVKEAIETFTKRAFDQLDKINIDEEAKSHLLSFGQELMSRKA